MAIVGWIVMGTLVGLVANRVVPGGIPGGAFGATVAGTLGAVLGGLLFLLVTDRGAIGFELASLVLAFVAAVALLTLLRLAGGNETLSADPPRAETQTKWPDT